MRSRAPSCVGGLLAGTAALTVHAAAIAQQPSARLLGAADYSTQAFVFERIRETLRFDDDGRGVFSLAVRVRVQTEAGLQALGQLTLPYGAVNQRLDVDTVRSELLKLRTVPLNATFREDVTTEVRVLFAPGPKVEEVRFMAASAAVRGLEPAIRKATFPVEFPDSGAIKLPRRALLSCRAHGACSLVLIEPDPLFPLWMPMPTE